MDNNELKSHIKEYEKEYRWLAKNTEITFKFLTTKPLSFPTDMIVEIMRQYANEQKKPDCELCGFFYWSKSSPKIKMCSACDNNFMND
jgi:hypothetical protein